MMSNVKHAYLTLISSIFMICLLLCGAQVKVLAQNNVGIGTISPDASAKLDVSSNNQGVLVPRMTAAQRTAISNPATGLLVYQTDGTSGFYFYNGSWISLSTDKLPAQSGQSGKILQTNGTTPSWTDPVITEGVRYFICATGIYPSSTNLGGDSHFIGEVIMAAFAPNSPHSSPSGSWLPCNGQLLNISTYQVLYSLVGTTYGGDGVTTFALPNLNSAGKVPKGR